MAAPVTAQRRLVVNADDFGRSNSINSAVIRAHREGILTTTSLMINEPAAAEAAGLALAHPGLGVGLHLVLLCGRSALPKRAIPDLVDDRQRFSDSPIAVGLRYFFGFRLREQLRDEIRAQLEAFRQLPIPPDHVNGHLHLHLHPVVLRILLDLAPEFKIRHVRLTRDPLRLNLRIARGNLSYRLIHALVLGLLARRARPHFDRAGFRYTTRVFGLLQNANVNEHYLLQLLKRLPPGISELYSHPSLDDFKHEFEALISPAVIKATQDHRIQLLRYQDL